MIRYKSKNKKYIILLIILDMLMFWAAFAMYNSHNYVGPIRLSLLLVAIKLLYYIIITTTSVYYASEKLLIYKTLFRKIEFEWDDVIKIKSKKSKYGFFNYYSIRIYSKNSKASIPITSEVENYKNLFFIIFERSKNNEGVIIEKEIRELFAND